MINTCLMWVAQNSEWEVHHLGTFLALSVPPHPARSENVLSLGSELGEFNKMFFHVEGPYEICLDFNVIF